MTRTIQDENLAIWEAYASAGDFGFPARSRIVFHCLSDRTLRARALARDRDKAAVEEEISNLSEGKLAELLARAEELK